MVFKKNPLIRKVPYQRKIINKNKSKGILDDFAVRKNVATKEGTIEKVPVNDSDIANKKYVDDAVDNIALNTGIDLFGYDSDSDIGGYKQLKLTASDGVKASGVVNVAGNATAQLAGARITEVGIDCQAVIHTLTAGAYNFHVHMKAASANRIKVFVKFYIRAAGGTETLIGTSNSSPFLTTIETGYDVHATLTIEHALVAGDRIVGKAYASNASAAATDLTIYVEGDTASRISVRGLSAPRQHDSLGHLAYADAGHTGFQATLGADQIIDWTADASPKVIHAANYTDTNTQLSEGDIAGFGFTKDVEVDWTISQSPAVVHSDNYTDTDTTAHASFSQLDYASAGHTGFQPTLSANQIIDWTSDQGATNINAGNYTNTTYSASDFSHNSLSGLNDGDSYEHITQTQKTALHSQNTDTALGSGAVAADHGTAATDQIINVCYGTGTPPTANTTTIGTLFVKYTA